MEWLSNFLASLGTGVTFDNPAAIGTLFFIGLISEIGFPLVFSIETFLFFISYDIGPLSSPALITVLMLLTGRQAGAAILYTVSRALGTIFLNWLGRHFPRLVKTEERLRSRLESRNIQAVTVVRLTPGLLQVPSITAGIIKMRYWEFGAGVAASSLIYDFILILLGFIARFALPHLAAGPKTFLIIGLVVIIILVWLITYFTSSGLFHRNSKASESISNNKKVP